MMNWLGKTISAFFRLKKLLHRTTFKKWQYLVEHADLVGQARAVVDASEALQSHLAKNLVERFLPP